jgi:hypothetical protein
MLDEFARSEGLSIKDEITQNQFIRRITDKVQKHRKNPSLLHGFRVESMFAHVAAALGECKIIDEEDSGIFFSIDEEICRPDFRIITRSGDQYFIEVKNFHPTDPLKPFRIKGDYLSKLRAFARSFAVPLRIAIYWSPWNMWSLVDVDRLDRISSDFQISLPEAMKRNEMSLLGDRMVATVPPLSLRLYADSQKPRSLGKDGNVAFTIGRVVMCVAGKEITDQTESRLAWFFMLYGKWDEVNQLAKVVDGLLNYFEMTVAPMEFNHKQGFAILGSLSDMISKHYNQLTAEDGEIRRLIPQQQPDQLGILIPHDYKGRVLKLWRFTLQPNYDDVVKQNISKQGDADRQ